MLSNNQSADTMGTSTDTRSPKHKLLDNLLAAKGRRNLRTYVKAERAKGTSWRLIAKAVSDITGEDISPPALIAWFPEQTEAVAE